MQSVIRALEKIRDESATVGSDYGNSTIHGLVCEALESMAVSASGLWRVGRTVRLNVYKGDRPMFQCHTPEDAADVVALLNRAQSSSVNQQMLTALKGIVEYVWTTALESFDTNQGHPEQDFGESDPEGFMWYKDARAAIKCAEGESV